MFEIVTLDNGLRVALEEMEFVRSVAFGIWVKNGSRNENPASSGISHFIEHMLFKGTDNRTAKDIADDMDRVGGHINAFTSKECTCYYTRTLDKHFDQAIDVLTDMFFRSKFDNAEIAKERNVILEEIDMYEDTPEDMVHDLLQYNVYQGNSLGASILGTESTISAFDHDFFVRYFNANYTPDRIVVSIVGRFDKSAALKKIEERFKDFKKPAEPPSMIVPASYRPCIASKAKPIEQTHISLSFPCISVGDKRTYDLIALNALFGGGMSSRLFQAIREERGLAYTVYSYPMTFTDTGMYSIYAALNAAQVEEVISLAFREIRNLYTDRITEAQLGKAKEQLKSSLILGLESTANRMSTLGRSQLLLGETLSDDEIDRHIDAVTVESVYKMADLIFDLDKASFAAVGNFGDKDFSAMLKKAASS